MSEIQPSQRAPVSRLGLAAYLLAALVVLIDQLSKAWVMGPLDLPGRGSIPVLPFLRLTLVMNRGVSFGLLRADQPQGRWLLVAAALAVVLFLIGWVRRTQRPLFAAAVGLVIGGAIGNNLIDRVRIGQVVDFLDVSALYFPWVFNVADTAINIGVALLLLDSLMPARGSRPSADPAPGPAP